MPFDQSLPRNPTNGYLRGCSACLLSSCPCLLQIFISWLQQTSLFTAHVCCWQMTELLGRNHSPWPAQMTSLEFVCFCSNKIKHTYYTVSMCSYRCVLSYVIGYKALWNFEVKCPIKSISLVEIRSTSQFSHPFSAILHSPLRSEVVQSK